MEQFISLVYNENMKMSFISMRAENRNAALSAIKGTLRKGENCLLFNEGQLIDLYRKMSKFFGDEDED